jgi:hypothetical protein
MCDDGVLMQGHCTYVNLVEHIDLGMNKPPKDSLRRPKPDFTGLHAKASRPPSTAVICTCLSVPNHEKPHSHYKSRRVRKRGQGTYSRPETRVTCGTTLGTPHRLVLILSSSSNTSRQPGRVCRGVPRDNKMQEFVMRENYLTVSSAGQKRRIMNEVSPAAILT